MFIQKKVTTYKRNSVKYILSDERIRESKLGSYGSTVLLILQQKKIVIIYHLLKTKFSLSVKTSNFESK